MNKFIGKRAAKAIICLIMATLCVTFSAAGVFAETKEEIYQSHAELDPFTDPDKFVEKYGLVTEGDFDPQEYDYFFYNLSTMINISDNNVLDVTELIDVYFKAPMNGITRTISRVNPVTDASGAHAINYAKITGVYSDSPVSTRMNGDEMLITLGGSDLSFQGFKQFRLHYTIDLGKDPIKGGDEFLFSIISPYLERPLLRCQFEINMPKEFDADKLKLIYMQRGENGSDPVSYEISGQTIKGETDYHFNGGQALTCKIMLPEGYFGNAENIYDASSLVSLGAATLMAIICSVIILRSQKANRFTVRLEYYPPKEINSLQAAYLKYGRLEDKKIISLMPYLASRGYIGIKEISKGMGRPSRQNTGYFFKQLRPVKGLPPDEKAFMEGMFGSGNKPKNDDEEQYVTDETLRYSFFRTIEKIKDHCLNDKASVCAMLFAKDGVHIKAVYTAIIMLLSCIGVALPLSFDSTHTGEGFSFFTFILLCIIICGFVFAMRFFHILVKSILCIVAAAIGLSALSLGETTLFASEIAAYTSLIVMLVMCMFYDTVKMIRTPYGRTLLGRLKGFERFLKTGDYGKLEKLLEENPNYYYDILPYTYALDINIPKNKKLEAEFLSHPPEWFEITNEASTFSFYNITYLLDAMNADMTYRPTQQNADISAILGDSFKNGGGFGI